MGKNATTAPTFFEQNRKTGYSQQFNSSIQRELPGNSVVEVSFLGNISHHLPSANLNINQIRPELLGPSATQKDRPFPAVQRSHAARSNLGRLRLLRGRGAL